MSRQVISVDRGTGDVEVRYTPGWIAKLFGAKSVIEHYHVDGSYVRAAHKSWREVNSGMALWLIDEVRAFCLRSDRDD